MTTSSSNDPSTYSAGTTPTGSEELLVNQSGSLVYLTALQLTQFSYSTVGLWKTYDTVAQMKADASATYPRVKWRGYNYVGDGGSGEGIYATGTYTADEGTVFTTKAGGYVLRDIPYGDVKTTWFGMTAPSGAAGTVLNPTSSAAPTNPTTDFSPALQAAANFAAKAGRALHIVGRAGAYRLMATVTFAGIRKIYGDGPILDANFGTNLQWYPSSITDQSVGIVLTDNGQLFENIAVSTYDTGYLGMTAQTLISGGWLTLPSGFVAAISTLPYSAFQAGLFGIRVDNKCVLRNVNTTGGKGGVIANCGTGHIVFDNCSITGGLVGRYWLKNGEDHFIIGGGADGQFCCEMMTELAVAVTTIRYHQYHHPYGWYQVSTGSTATPAGFNIHAVENSVEGMGEAWIWLADNSVINSISYDGGGVPYGSPSDVPTASNNLPAEFFANSVRNYACSGRFGRLDYLRFNTVDAGIITANGGAGTYAARISGFPQKPRDSDFTIFDSIDTSGIASGYENWRMSIPVKRNVFARADRSDIAVKTKNPPIGNMVLNTSAYSASLGLGVAGNALAANGGAWTAYNGNSTYPGSFTLTTYAALIAAGTALVIPENIARQVGPNPFVFCFTNTAPVGTSAVTSAYQPISANNVADGQQGLYMSFYVAGSYNAAYRRNGTTDYTTGNLSTADALTFESVTLGGRVLASGDALTEFSFGNNVSNSTTYFMAPMLNFGAWTEYNPHQHPAALDPLYLSSGLRQAGRAFLTTTASGSATTAVTIADFLVTIDATAAAGTVTLPSKPFDGEVHIIKKVDASANAVTVNGNGKLIDGASTYVISGNARGSVRLQYIGSAATPYWCVV